jgi:hypothetical protein
MKHTKATRYIVESAQRCINGNVTVDVDSSYQTVSIDAPGEESIFMQGDEAQDFIDQRDALTKRYPSLSDYVAELALAEPYTDLWS